MPIINSGETKSLFKAIKSGAKKAGNIFRKNTPGPNALKKDSFTPRANAAHPPEAKISPESSYEDITQAVKSMSEASKPSYRTVLYQPNLRTAAYRQSKLQQEHRLQNLGLVNAGKKPVTFEQFAAQKAEAKQASMDTHFASSHAQPVDYMAYQASGYRPVYIP